MSDYDYCKKHDCSFLVPEVMMCPYCAEYRLRQGDVPEPLGDALVERIDSLIREVEALKARKVKLPEGESERGGYHESVADAMGYNRALEKCADAIRTAGIGIEGEG